MLKVPILTYHSWNVAGNTYATNDHLALYTDIRTLHAQGWIVVPLLWVVEWVLGQRDESTLQQTVALTFDDGTDFDYHDSQLPVPRCPKKFL